MTGSGAVKLAQLFLFNPTWGPREGQEEKKVVFFWPKETEPNTQVRMVGLVEAVDRFSQTFSKRSAHSLHNQKTRMVWREVEQDFYLCFNVNIPFTRKVGGKETKEGPAESLLEFRPEDVNDSVLLSVLDRAHNMFSLFQGGLQSLLLAANGDKSVVREQVDHFYTRYLASLRLEQASLLELWGGVQYLPLQSGPFLRVQTLVTRAQEEFPTIQSSLFLQQGQMVWSGLSPSHTRLLVHYLTTSLLPSLPTLPNLSPTSPHQGRFLVGGDISTPLPRVHVTDAPLFLVVFHAINSTVCLLLSSLPSTSFYSSLSNYLGPPLSDLSADLTHLWATGGAETGSADQVRFIYFNQANYAVKSTVESGNENLVHLAAELSADLGPSGGEVTAKLHTDQWVVVRVAGVRTVVVVLQARNLNLMEVAEEVGRLDRSSFGKICML